MGLIFKIGLIYILLKLFQGYKGLNITTKTIKINNEKFSENIFLMMSLFFPYYEGGIVREIHVKDISKNKNKTDNKYGLLQTKSDDAKKLSYKNERSSLCRRTINNQYVSNELQ